MAGNTFKLKTGTMAILSECDHRNVDTYSGECSCDSGWGKHQL
jgi:hypothetical protein